MQCSKALRSGSGCLRGLHAAKRHCDHGAASRHAQVRFAASRALAFRAQALVTPRRAPLALCRARAPSKHKGTAPNALDMDDGVIERDQQQRDRLLRPCPLPIAIATATRAYQGLPRSCRVATLSLANMTMMSCVPQPAQLSVRCPARLRYTPLYTCCAHRFQRRRPRSAVRFSPHAARHICKQASAPPHSSLRALCRRAPRRRSRRPPLPPSRPTSFAPARSRSAASTTTTR